MRDKEERREGHEFPVAVKAARAVRGNDSCQGGKCQEQEEPVPALTFLIGHISYGVDGNDKGTDRHEHKEKL